MGSRAGTEVKKAVLQSVNDNAPFVRFQRANAENLLPTPGSLLSPARGAIPSPVRGAIFVEPASEKIHELRQETPTTVLWFIVPMNPGRFIGSGIGSTLCQ